MPFEPYNYNYTTKELKQFTNLHLTKASLELEDMYRVIAEGQFKILLIKGNRKKLTMCPAMYNHGPRLTLLLP